jgi:parallel beta-helix repeat protein
LNANIGPCPGDGLVIGSSNIVLNCAGHTIHGLGELGKSRDAGINLTGIARAMVENCNITGAFSYGFYLYHSSGDNLTRNTADSTYLYGFYLIDSNGSTLTGNTANGDNTGFYLDHSSDSALTRNTADSSPYGFGFWITDASNGNTLTGNTGNNDGNGFALLNSSGNNLAGNTANGDRNGIVLDSSNSSTLTDDTADNNSFNGFNLVGSTNNNLSGNVANNNTYYGFELGSGSSNNNLSGNVANNNTRYGYYDATAGSGTGGTANSYSGDECSGNGVWGSGPSGLCSPQGVGTSSATEAPNFNGFNLRGSILSGFTLVVPALVKRRQTEAFRTNTYRPSDS